jgi:hypothetical protein
MKLKGKVFLIQLLFFTIPFIFLFAFIQQLSLNPFKPDAFLIRGLG